MKQTKGIHHITSIVGHPQENAAFYSTILGLRLIKKTVNFDDPQTYHLYFGNEQAEPGTIITFFPWTNGSRGKIGSGQVGITSYAVPKGSLPFWEKRLSDKGIDFTKATRFDEAVLQFEDTHGLKLELVERDGGSLNSWSNDGISEEHAIKGFAGAVLFSGNPKATIQTLTDTMGLTHFSEENGVVRLTAEGDLGNTVDIPLEAEAPGEMGVGTVHHIAWRAEDEADHKDWLLHVKESGFQATDVKDRNYFKALYFREYGGILFEIASETPGFTVDEPLEQLGQKLMLPEQYEPTREKLERILPPIN